MKKYYLVVLVLPWIMACAHSATERQVDTKMAAHPELDHHGDLDAAAREHIEDAQGLDEKQRSELAALRERTHATMSELHGEALKLKSLAIANATNPEGDHRELQAIKNRILKAEKRRLDVFFEAIDRSLKIVDRESKSRGSANRGWIFRDMMLDARVPSN